jgi:hypothetical protein
MNGPDVTTIDAYIAAYPPAVQAKWSSCGPWCMPGPGCPRRRSLRHPTFVLAKLVTLRLPASYRLYPTSSGIAASRAPGSLQDTGHGAVPIDQPCR